MTIDATQLENTLKEKDAEISEVKYETRMMLRMVRKLQMYFYFVPIPKK